ncbi:MAG: hypothetical protein CMC79_05920 [Flavobacteriaceae bacterium]|nr:hypothetical protein [Flavobacteriaceae bacterium]
MVNNLVLIGASSEIAEKLIIQNKNFKFNIHGVSTKELGNNFLKVTDYIDESEEILKYIEKINKPILIFFNGYLKENRDTYFPNDQEIHQTLYVNFLVPYLLSLKLVETIKYKKLVYISSIAAVKPRYKNYIYGLSKKTLENSIKNMDNKNTLIIRFGKVKTNMSKDHKDPPFTISSNKAADIIFNSLNRNGIVYSSLGIYISSLIIKYLPLKFINYIERRSLSG